MERIIGIHYGHDANVAIVESGKVIFAISEERLNRDKFYEGFPFLAIQESLRCTGLSACDFDKVALSNSKAQDATLGNHLSTYFERLGKKTPLFARLISVPVILIDNIFMLKIRKIIAVKMIHHTVKGLGFRQYQIEEVEHHLCHAAGAFFMSEYNDAIIITGDGKGDNLSHQTYRASNGRFNLLSQSPDYASIGLFYSLVTKYLGFKPLRHEGKITGLAAFGKSDNLPNVPYPLSVCPKEKRLISTFLSEYSMFKNYRILMKIFMENKNLFFNLIINKSYFEFEYVRYKWEEFIENYFSNSSKEDVAFYAQYHFEKILVEMVKQVLPNEGANVVLSGGNYANVKVNQRIREIDGVHSVFIMPAMGDGGLAAGAALWGYWSKRNWGHKPLHTAYLGSSYSNSEIEDALRSEKLNFTKKENISKYIAEQLAKDKIVGRYNGKMEWGPRALGNRSILASAKDDKINQTLNDRLSRTEFMPFAPVIMAEHAQSYFPKYKSSHTASKFMTITYDVSKELQNNIAAAVHIDGTARPQVVSKNDNSDLYDILNYYYEITGVPALINTSFNMHEEPIVCTPQDAIRAFRSGAVDVLAIGDYVVVQNCDVLIVS